MVQLRTLTRLGQQPVVAHFDRVERNPTQSASAVEGRFHLDGDTGCPAVDESHRDRAGLV